MIRPSFSLLALGFGVVLLASGCERVPRRSLDRPYTIEQLMSSTRLSGADISPAGDMLAYSSTADGFFNVYRQRVAGGPLEQLTQQRAAALHVVSWFPDGQNLLLQADRGPDKYQLQVLQPSGMTVPVLADTNIRSYFLGWAGSPKQMYFLASTPPRNRDDVYVLDQQTLTARRVLANDSLLTPEGVSPDGRLVALLRFASNLRSELYLYDIPNQTYRRIISPNGPGKVQFMGFTPDSQRLLYLSDEGSEFMRLMAYDIASGQSQVLYQSTWDVSWARTSNTGRWIAVVVNQDAHNELRLLDTRTGEVVPLPGLPAGEIKPRGFTADDRQLLFYLTSAQATPNLYVYDLQQQSSRQLTSTMTPGVDSRKLVRPEIARFTSFDSLQIPVLVYSPPNARPGANLPAVVNVHGGPSGQARIGYQPLIQYLVSNGYVVIEVNYRGSAGYGRTFAQLDDRQHGYNNLRDIVHTKQFLAQLGTVDTNRVAVMGAGYGGYLALSAMAFHPESFAAGVDLFGILNWPRLLQGMPSWWQNYRTSLYAEMGDPVRDSARFAARSPLVHARQIDRPLLVLAGVNDQRVPLADVNQLVENLRERAVPVEFIVYQDEGHGIRKRENELHAYANILRFLNLHLRRQQTLPN